jgi:drug/metabolite transporter (DMT)-like permease
MISIASALGACLAFGVSDFLAGVRTRTVAGLTVLLSSQLTGLVVILVATIAVGDRAPPLWFLPRALAAGVLGVLGIAAFWRGMAVGRISTVAPMAAAAPVIPIIVGLASGERPGLVQLLGMPVIVCGVVAVGRAPEGQKSPDGPMAVGTGLGIAAAVCFGLTVALLGQATHGDHEVFWTVLTARVAAVVCVAAGAIASRRRPKLHREDVPSLVAIGVLDLSANFLVVFALAHGLLSVAAVLMSLHTVVTVGLGRMVLGERLTKVQILGLVSALFGAALVGAG